MNDISFEPILFPMVAHVFWVAALYAALTVARAPDVWSIGTRADGTNPWAHLEPRIAANLSNQFEWPLMFYVACTVGLGGQAANAPAFLVLSWIFVAGRIFHSGVQILTTNIRARGLVFSINFAAVLCMWAFLLV